ESSHRWIERCCGKPPRSFSRFLFGEYYLERTGCVLVVRYLSVRIETREERVATATRASPSCISKKELARGYRNAAACRLCPWGWSGRLSFSPGDVNGSRPGRFFGPDPRS